VRRSSTGLLLLLVLCLLSALLHTHVVHLHCVVLELGRLFPAVCWYSIVASVFTQFDACIAAPH
jgi:hypothetical protein